jgi:hypothetical protein
VHKIIAAISLLGLWIGVGWIMLHQRRISRELVENEAMPRPGPRATFLVLIGAIVIALSGWLLYFIWN